MSCYQEHNLNQHFDSTTTERENVSLNKTNYDKSSCTDLAMLVNPHRLSHNHTVHQFLFWGRLLRRVLPGFEQKIYDHHTYIMHLKNVGKRPLTSKHGRGNGVAVRARQNCAFSGMHVTKLLGTDFRSVSLTQPLTKHWLKTLHQKEKLPICLRSFPEQCGIGDWSKTRFSESYFSWILAMPHVGLRPEQIKVSSLVQSRCGLP